ncbi:MAG: TIGR00730 family Rossman fold protein [Bryobacteraceae bacterium]
MPYDKDESSDVTSSRLEGFRRPVAYREEAFLRSPESRPLRILSEYLWPLAHFQDERIQDTIVFFGSARIEEDGPLGRYYREARGLARLITEWAASISEPEACAEPRLRFVVCSGGGPGIMEAANRGASDAGGKTIGLNIGLPFEQRPNPFITPDLCFEFQYFFMRKFWFAYLAKALVVFPGGFGTLDELMEILTLAQTRKLESKILIVLYGSEFWKEILNFEALVKYGVISEQDLTLFRFVDTPEAALHILKEDLTRYYLEPERALQRPIEEAPEIARTRTS